MPDREKLLQELGFIKDDNTGRYIHELIRLENGTQVDFDFSASSLEGIIKKVYKTGKMLGRIEKAREIRAALTEEGPYGA